MEREAVEEESGGCAGPQGGELQPAVSGTPPRPAAQSPADGTLVWKDLKALCRSTFCLLKVPRP